MENFDYEPMEMPTPCEHCGTIFDLNDGRCSEKWHPNTTICEKCYEEEELEIEEDDRWEEINLEISNALYIPKTEEGAWGKVADENKALIIQLVSQHSELLLAYHKWYLEHRGTVTDSSPEAMVKIYKANNCG